MVVNRNKGNINLSSPPLGVFTLCAAEYVNYI
jgi:hypothetical protein